MLERILQTFLVLLFVNGSALAGPNEAISAFHDDVAVGDVEVVRQKLTVEPSLATSHDEFGFRPVHLMDLYPEEEILGLLLTNGADVNAVNDEGITILHIITEPDFVPILLKHGANIEARDMRGRTPLIAHANEQQDGPDVLMALLENGADVNAKGNEGETALQSAIASGDQTVISMLKAYGAIE